MEDAFVILLFTFFTQQLQLLWRRSEDDDSDPPLRSQSDPQHTERPGSSKKQPSSTAFFPWLEVDVQADECRDYFPADVIRNVIPNPSNPTPLKLSVVLEAFQQFFGKFQALLRENQSLQRRGRMYDDLFKKYRILEEKLAKSRLDQTSGHNGLTHGHATDLMKQKIAELQEQLRQVGPLQRAYARSEDRCKQLVEVTQQWSIECEGKMKVVRILEKEVEQLKAQVQHLEGRVNKYKKYWADTKDLHLGRATDAQFEELRSELASRRLLYDQVLAQRDEAMKKVQVLLLENESLKDHNVQLMDRADNFKIQAQAKEPSVREMSNLLEEKRKLEAEVESLKKDSIELSDKSMGLEILVEDLTVKLDHVQGVHKPNTKRSQAMVIGHGTPLRAQQPQLGHASQFLDATPTTTTTSSGGSHQQRSESSRARDEDEIQSLASSEASESGKFSSFGSTTSERQSLRSGGAASTKMPSSANPPQSNHSSFGSHDLPLRSRDPSVDDELASGGGPRDGREPESGDYTHRVRYPNNSRILIAPLLDEEISLKGGIAGSPGVANFRDEDSVVKSKPPQSQARGEGKTATSSKDKDPFYCDRSHFDYQVPVYPSQQSYPDVSCPLNQPTAFLPPTSPLLQPNIHEKKCPVCQHSFFALSEKEFQAHVATCYR